MTGFSEKPVLTLQPALLKPCVCVCVCVCVRLFTANPSYTRCILFTASPYILCVCVCVSVRDCLQPTLLILCVYCLQLALIFCVCSHRFSHVLTVCDPVDHSLPGSSVHGIFLTRILDWVAISLSILYPVNGKLCPEGLSLSFACWRYLTVGLSCSLDKLAPAEKNRPLL